MDKKYYFNDINKPIIKTNDIKKVILFQIILSEKYNCNNIIIEAPKTRIVKFD